MRLIVSRRWADVHGGRLAGKLRIADSARLAFVRPALPARLTLRKCHESETDLGVIAVRQPRKPRSHMINMSCAMRPYRCLRPALAPPNRRITPDHASLVDHLALACARDRKPGGASPGVRAEVSRPGALLFDVLLDAFR
jgi:hypothetical protein